MVYLVAALPTQYFFSLSPGTVRQLLHEKIRDAYIHPQFISDVMKPLMIEEIIDQEVQNLSGKLDFILAEIISCPSSFRRETATTATQKTEKGRVDILKKKRVKDRSL